MCSMPVANEEARALTAQHFSNKMEAIAELVSLLRDWYPKLRSLEVLGRRVREILDDA